MAVLALALSMVVLLTALIVAFFAATGVNRTVEKASSNTVAARILAEGAVSAIEGEFLREIEALSSNQTFGGVKTYAPKTSADIVPQRAVSDVYKNDSGFANLVKQSGQPFFTGGTPSIFNFTTNTTTETAGSDGRKILPARWNAPMLTGKEFSTGPKWIYVNSVGYQSVTDATTMGRIAFNVYDVGGLLDINAAGYASGAPTQVIAAKGALAWAELSNLPGLNATSTNTDSWPPKWRITGNWTTFATGNLSNSSSSLEYYRRTGWLEPFYPSGGTGADRMFASRQDLIRYAKANPSTFLTSGNLTTALQYLTTFSRALNAPSWSPPLNASQMTPNYLDALKDTKDPNVPRNYKDKADDSTSVNRNVMGVRVSSGGWRRINGEATVAGEPLIKCRFPLSWLAVLRDASPTTTAWDVTPEATTILNSLNTRRATNGQTSLTMDALVQQAFGLKWNSGSGAWEYRADTILRFDQVASLTGANAREPDFFELLKAGILNGSLGKSTPADSAFIANFLPDRNKDLQILKIGANIIDQADPDDAPTTIIRPELTEIVLGIENHPYIYLMSQTHFRRKDIPPDPSAGDPVTGNPMPYATCYQQMEVWNPHTNATATGRSYRVRALQGSSRVSAGGIGMDGPLVTQQDLFIGFNGNQNFSEPTLLNKTNIDAGRTSPGNMLWTTGNASNAILAGFLIGNIKLNNNVDGLTPDRPYDDYPSAWLIISPQIPIIYQLEYSDGGRWIPVQRTYPVKGTYGNGMSGGPMWGDGRGQLWDFTEIIYNGGKYPAIAGLGLNTPYPVTMMLVACKTDPRVQRLGVFGAGGVPPDNTTLRRSNANSGYPAWHTVDGMSWDCNTWNFLWKAIRPLPTAFPGRNENADTTLDDLSDNRMDSPTLIADPDGVVRQADGTRTTNIPGDKTGVAATDNPRPVILNRPFASVAEMGYACRDDPWKTLDFASAFSADSALLDLFSAYDMPVVQAGMVNLNRAPAPVLEAILTKAATDPVVSTTSSISDANAKTIATNLASNLTTQTVQNRADLAGLVEKLGTIPGAVHKRQMEEIPRALADVSNIRTWNLMIDLVAQTGRYPQSASSINQFIVDGEKRYWVHLAVDRFTGKVIDKQVEVVNE
ncbi:MAG: hypothetical protein NTU84_06160 [Verrucomicrobia bacterium]|nr:hypothetical protein [Verrucomicrobiota bacterium]